MIREVSLRESVRLRVVEILEKGSKTMDEIMEEGFGPFSGMHLSRTFVENLTNESVSQGIRYTRPSENGGARVRRIYCWDGIYLLGYDRQNS